MAANPDSSRITAEMWRFWEEFKKIEPTVRLGGIYANKPGYHNARNNLPASDYSKQLANDKLGPGQYGSAIDLTFPSAQAGNPAIIAKYSSRLLKSGKDLNDDRGNYLREFYGQADSDSQVEGWDFQYVRPASSDSSHLWHIHLSFMRRYNNDRKAHDAILSILRGETYAHWKASQTAPPAQPVLKANEIFIEGVGVATVEDVAKAVWDYKLNDAASSTPTAPVVTTAGNQLRYARVDSYRPTAKWLSMVVDAVKAFLKV